MSDNKQIEAVEDLASFDRNSGNRAERLIFNGRLWIIALCALLTAFFAAQLPTLKVSASFEKMLPQSHPYITSYLDNRGELRGLGDTVRVVIENKSGDIYDADFLATLARINDEIFLLPGVDRAWMKSIFTPVVRWVEVTEEGFDGGPVMPDDYNGSRDSIEELRINIGRAGIVGDLVSNDARSAAIVIPLLAVDGDGKPIDYHALATSLENIRAKYTRVEGSAASNVNLYIIGFAKLVGDLIDGLTKVLGFFALSAAVGAAILYSFTRCVRSSALVLACSLVAVVWQLGAIALVGGVLDPFSVLVPFLVFAIGVSHGSQKMNGIMQDIGRGMDKYVAARYTFRRLFMAGLTGLVSDAVGFGVLMVVDIPVTRELAMAASLGVAILILTNMILLPILLSYTGVNPKAALRSLSSESSESAGRGMGRVWAALDRLTEKRAASVAVLIAAVLGVWGYQVSLDVKVGDLDAGAPELRADSRYNLDNAFITSNFGVSSDLFAIMVKTPEDRCGDWANLTEIDRLGWTLEQVPGVQRTTSLASTMRGYIAGSFEGNPKWYSIPDSQSIVDAQMNNAISWNSEFLNPKCSISPVIAYLADHRAETLDVVVAAADKFAREHSSEERQFLLAAGSAGVEAATNMVVREANRQMLYYVYGAVAVICLIAFRSWRATLVALIPLALISVLAEALMVKLGIGIKVSTLPVIALGVGVGIDYALYLVSVMLAQLRMGHSLAESYKRAVAFTGKVVAVIGVTLAAGVVTWAWSPIKFQADMGILLTFMFVSNMIAALTLVPALSYFLLGPKARKPVPELEIPGMARPALKGT